MIKNDWLQDYEEFVDCDCAPSQEVTNKLMNKMNRLMNPNSLLVFSKVFSINILVGFLSLAICHQFGLNPFNTERSLDSWFMHVGGHQVCMVLCGVVFITVSILAAGFVLNIEEVLKLKQNKFLQVASLSLFSLAFLFLIGAEFALGIGLLWLAGALVGGLVATETVWRFKYSAA